MSWDLFIMNFPATARKVADITEDFKPAPLGRRAELIAQIRELIPAADFSDPSWGDYDGDGFSIEFNMGPEEICQDIMLIVRGGGNPTPLIGALLDRLQFRGIDCQTSEFFDVEAARASFGTWQRWRDQAIGQINKQGT